MYSLSAFRAYAKCASYSAVRHITDRIGLLSLLAVGLGLSVIPSAQAANPSKPAPPVEVIGAVEIIGEPFKTPFRIIRNGNISSGANVSVLPMSLPAGKRIVIETVSVAATVPPGSIAQGYIYISTAQGDEFDGQLWMPFAANGTVGNRDLYVATSPSLIRVDTDSATVHFNLARTGAGEGSFSVTLLGYIEEI